jgi:hypothetical protein
VARRLTTVIATASMIAIEAMTAITVTQFTGAVGTWLPGAAQ